jgi:hypothetical protein
VGTIAAGVAKAHADVILIMAMTAAPALRRRAASARGSAWELGLAETQPDAASEHLRSRVIVETDGKLMTGGTLWWQRCWAPRSSASRRPRCGAGVRDDAGLPARHLPTGVATQNPELRQALRGLRGLRGEPDALHRPGCARSAWRPWASGRWTRWWAGWTGWSRARRRTTGRRGSGPLGILARPEVGPDVEVRCTMGQDHGLETALDLTTLESIVATGHRARRARAGDTAHPQRKPRRGDPDRQRADAGRYGAAGLPETPST